jgi:hypothetical protein
VASAGDSALLGDVDIRGMSVALVVPHRAALLVVSIIILTGIGGLAYAYLPAAVITLYPTTTEETVSHNIVLSTHVDAPDFVRFILPARLLEHAVEETQTFRHEGGTTREEFARGRVTLVNDQDEEQPLLPKTHLRHEASGVFFLTDQAVTIPPKNKVTVSVTAKEKGERGNVPPGKFMVDRLPASLQAVVYGQSQQAFTGGVAVEQPITEAELTQARQTVRQAAEERARGELTAQAGGAHFRSDLLQLETESENVSAAVGSTANQFSVSLKLRARAFAADENDLLSMTLLSLRAQDDPNRELASYNPESFQLEVKRLDFDRGEAQITGKVTGIFSAKISSTLLNADNLAGRTAAEVEEYFKQYPTVGKVEVAFSPFWVKTVPSRSGATEIIVKAAK